MKKKVISCILAASMVLSMTACGKSSSTTADSTAAASSAQDSTTAASGDGAAADSAATAESVDVSKLEPVTLKMYFHGSNVTDDSQTMEAVNSYLKEKLNVTLEPIWGTWGDFDTNSVLSLQGGDDVDIYFTSSWSADEYNKFARDGYWVRLDDPENNLIQKYAPELWKTLPQVLINGATINGSDGCGVYAVPGYKDIATQNCWDVNVTKLKELGYTVDDIKNADYYTFGDILKKAKEKYGKDFYPLLVEGAVLERMVDNSIIVTGDSGTGNFMSYYINPDDLTQPSSYGNKILNKFATDEFRKFAEQTRKYYEAGYIDPAMGNANQANDTRSSKQLTGDYLIGTQSYSLGYELQASQERKIEVAMVPTTDPYVDTTSSQGAMMAISTASKNPERAMMFLNLLNTDPYLMTLLNYGVEGVHYNLNSDGLVEFTDKRSDYQPWTNGMGNVTILTPTADQGADFWTGFKSYYGEAKQIPILGYAYDATNTETQMGAVANVVAEYMLPLCTGTVDPDEKLPEFLKKLEENGINDVLDDANKQLDAYMAVKGE
ncbi:MAG: ABC transporter substrate-binding protein [Butyrivibrio sp.]|jgi:putative aldouronate transport system substrate-binding protein|nr:ABC transporter substrate-binding protein [Butyrivibrio sp.]